MKEAAVVAVSAVAVEAILARSDCMWSDLLKGSVASDIEDLRDEEPAPRATSKSEGSLRGGEKR